MTSKRARRSSIFTAPRYHRMVPPTEAERLHKPLIGVAAALAGLCYTGFGLAWSFGTWPAAILAPSLLWLGTQWVLVAGRFLFDGAHYMVRLGKAERFAFFSAVVVGVWLRVALMPWFALGALPAFALVEHTLRRWTDAPDPRRAPVPLAQWISHVTAGELLGFAAASFAHVLWQLIVQ